MKIIDIIFYYYLLLLYIFFEAEAILLKASALYINDNIPATKLSFKTLRIQYM